MTEFEFLFDIKWEICDFTEMFITNDLAASIFRFVYVWMYVRMCLCLCVCVTDWVKLCVCGIINFVRDVIWTCKDRINIKISIVLFKHHIGITLAQVDLCTLLNNVSRSFKRDHVQHKNDTKWFGIKQSFIRRIITYNS